MKREETTDIVARLFAERRDSTDGTTAATRERWERVERVFTAALEAGADRASVLARECEGNPELETEVTSLLRAHDTAGAADQLDRELGNVRQAGPSAGDRIGRYEILERLGAGGMAVVYRARDERLRRTVALKLLPRALSVDRGATQRFLLEAQSAAALDHPNICAIHEVAQSDDGQLYIVMALYEGETLETRIARGPLAVAEALAITHQIISGLEHAHGRGIVHRDIKPANLFLTADGSLKILDFGIAKVQDVSLTLSGAIVGTVPYISPEQAGGGGVVDHRTDLWSAGVVLYEMIAGRRPFEGPNAEATIVAILTADAPLVSGALGVGAASRVLARLLTKRVDERLTTASAALAAVEEALEAVPDGTPWDGADGAAPISPEGERRQVTALVAQVDGYDELVERLTSDQVERMVGRIRETATEIASRYGGMVHSFEGETLVCLFGVPETHEDDVARAVRAARDLHAAGTRVSDSEGTPLRFRSGVCAGVAVVQPDPASRAYQVSGDPLDAALHLAAHSTAHEILVGPECRRQLIPFFELRPGNAVALPERTDVITPYALVGESPSLGKTAEQPGLTPFLGRRRELATLCDALERAAAGDGVFATVEGEAGAGKSRLLYELDRSPVVDNLHLVRARCRAGGADGAPYLPFMEVMREILELGTAPAQSLDPELVASHLRDAAPVLTESLPLFLHLLGVQSERYPLPRHREGGQLRVAIRDAMAALCTEAAQRRPMVVQLEDWHWADQPSREVLLQLAELTPAHPLAVVVTYRPGYAVTWSGAVPRTTVQLGPLDVESAGHLIRAVLGARSVSQDVVETMHSRAGGNPFFLEELCHALREQGALAIRDGAATFRGRVEQLHLPVTIQSVIRTRFDRLERDTRELLRVASVVGRDFTASLLRLLVDHDAALVAALERLKELGIVQQTRLVPEPSYRFKHILTQEVAYDTLLTPRRRALHARVGEAIETLQADRLDELAHELAHHFGCAQVWQKAIRYGHRAARRAEGLSEFSRALGVLDQVEKWAHELRDEAQHRETLVGVLLQQERLCETLGLRKRQQEILEHLLGVLDTDVDRATLAEVYIRQGDHHTLVKRFGDAERVLQQAVDLNQELGDRLGERNALTSLGLTFWHQGRNDEGLRCIEQALAIDRALGDDHRIARDLYNLATMLRSLGELERALTALDEGRTMARNIEDPYLEGLNVYLIGQIHRARGETDRAFECLNYVVEIDLAHGYYIEATVSLTAMAGLQLERGDVDEALDGYRRAVEIARRIGNVEGLSQTLRMFGDVLMGIGRGPDALPHLREAADLFAQLESRGAEGQAWSRIGAIEEELGNLRAAAEAWGTAADCRRDQNDRPGELEAVVHRVRAMREAGEDPDEVRATYSGALELAKHLEDRETEAELLNGLGIFEWQVRRYETALDCYERALGIFTTLGNQPQAGLALNSIGATLVCLGRLEDARARLQEAVTVNRKSGLDLLEGHALGTLGDAHLAAGEIKDAASSYEASLAIRRRIGDRRGEGWMLHNLGRAAEMRGDHALAATFSDEARLIAAEIEDEALQHACDGGGAATETSN